MKKIFLTISFLAFSLFPLSAKAEITQYDESVIFGPDSILWEILLQFNRPDDPYEDCVDRATAFEVMHSEELQEIFQYGFGTYDVNEGIDEFCEIMGYVPGYVNQSFDSSGLNFEGSETTDLDLEADWKNIENLTFNHPWGKIELHDPVNLMSYDFIGLALAFESAFEVDQAKIGLNSDIISGLNNFGASITMYNLPDFENPIILIDGEPDNSGIISNFVYDRENHTITFDVAHFSTFEAIDESDDSGEAKISSWKARIYDDPISERCQTKVRLEINGKHFASSVKVRIGNKKPYSTDRKSSTKIVAKFCYDDLLKGKTSYRKDVKVKNPETENEIADKKIDVKKIKKIFKESDFDMQTEKGIKNIQIALFQLKYLESQNITGVYGPITKEAVKSFQYNNGIEQIGIVGPQTKKRLAEKNK